MIPVDLPGLPAPDMNVDRRDFLGDVDLTEPMVTPYGRVMFAGVEITGWAGGTDSTGSDEQKVGRPGAVASLDPQATPRVLNVSMTMLAESPAAMRWAWDRLNAVVSITDFTVTREEWGLRRTVTARRQGAIPEALTETATVRGWSAQLRCADPRKYGDRVVRSTRLPFTTGGLRTPLRTPVRSDATSSTGVVQIDLSGDAANAPSPVLLRIDGPIPSPYVRHRGLNRTLVFASSYVLPAGSWLDIDMDNQRVLENGLVTRAQFVTGRGWSYADPDVNEWEFGAAAYNDQAQLTVITAPAWF